MNNPSIPSGIFGESGEIFTQNGSVYALWHGKSVSFSALPFAVRKMYVELYLSDTIIQKGLDLMGIDNEDKRIMQTVICNGGGFDNKADFTENRVNREFYNCGQWETCPGFGMVCKVPGNLSRKEVLLVADIVAGMPDKQVSEKNEITHNTLRTHIKRINEKIRVHCRAQLVNWALNNVCF